MLLGAIMWFLLSSPVSPGGRGTSSGVSRFVPPFWEKGDQDCPSPVHHSPPSPGPTPLGVRRVDTCSLSLFFCHFADPHFGVRCVDADLVPCTPFYLQDSSIRCNISQKKKNVNNKYLKHVKRLIFAKCFGGWRCFGTAGRGCVKRM